MKSFRWTLIAIGAVGLLIAFTIYDTKRQEGNEDAKQKAASVLSIRAVDMVRLEFQKPRAQTPSIIIEREKAGSPWHLKSPVEDSTDDGVVPPLVGWLDSETSLDVIVDGEDFDPKTYGLDQPTFVLVVRSTDGRTEKVSIGSVDAYDGNLYAQVDGQVNGQVDGLKRVLLVANTWDMQMSMPVREFRDKSLVKNEVPAAEIGKIVLNNAKVPVVFERSNSETFQWKITSGDSLSSSFEVPLANDRVRSFIEAVQATKAVDFLADQKTEAQVKKHGLLSPPLEIELFKLDGSRATKLAFADVAGRTEALDVSALSSEREPIFAVQIGVVEALSKKPSDFYDRKYPFSFDPKDVVRIKLETPEITGEFVKNGETWSAVQEGLQKSIDSGVLNDLPAKIGRLEAIRFFDDAKAAKSAKASKAKGRIVLMKEAGESVFELNWGDLRNESFVAGEPEAQLRTVWTSRIDARVGIPEQSLTGLRLGLILGDSNPDSKK